MAAAASRPEMPSFSYAQAAKGLSTPPAQQPPKSSIDQTQTVATAADESSSVPANVSHKTSSSSTEPEPRGDLAAVDAALDSDSKYAGLPATKNVLSGTSSPSVGTASTSTVPKEDDASLTPNGTSESTWDKQSQSSIALEKSSAGDDTKKDAPSDASAADKPAPPPKELKAAPLPTVNVWQVRLEAQEAKAKATAVALKSVSASTPKPASGKPSAPSSHSAGENQDQSKAASRKKQVPDGQVEGGSSHGKERRRNDAKGIRDETGSRKTSNRSTRNADETNETPPPPVADATAWPTPQTALGEEKKKVQDKHGEKPERTEKSPVSRAHGNQKWTPVPYVPTAVFNTPLPSGARRGGRSGRGGQREGGRGGAHSVSAHSPSENNTNSNAPKLSNGQSVPGSAQKASTVADRGRNETVSPKSNSLPAAPRTATSADANSQQEQKKTPPSFDRPRGEFRPKALEDTHAGVNGTQTANPETSSKPHRETKYFGRNSEAGPPHKFTEHPSRNGNAQADGHASSRYSSNYERRLDGQPKSADPSRELPTFVPRERENRDFARDRGDYRRERDHPRDRGDSRPERGRGGYRGRGGHSYGASQNAHYSNSQLSQHSFVPPKSYPMNERQRSQPQGYQNGIQSQNSNQRMSLRSPSLPNTAGLYNTYPLPELNTVYSYPQVHPGPMTAIPYQPYMEPFSLMGMIQMQLEYYFSVDNLCKDLYLRRHMDSQGYVLLTFIASFKRIKNLTEDFELLRHCCRQLRNVEHHCSEDGVDRLRPRERWEQWVLSIDQRDQSAQNAGPSNPKSYSPGHAFLNGTPTFQDSFDKANQFYPAPAMANGHSPDQTQIVNLPVNGHSEHHPSRVSLSSTAPEFTPHAPVVASSDNANCKHSLAAAL